MIETGLVYIYSVSAHDFIGCGALVEGGYIATCRHVWRDATGSESREADDPPKVAIEFAAAQDGGTAFRAGLADACEGLDARAPDLVLLKPDLIPDGIMRLQLARRADYEIGPGQCHCYLQPRDIDCFIYGEISSGISLKKGMRQFTGNNGQSHWMEEGSSGSPVFLKEKAQQLAGIIALAEVVQKKGETRKHEAFIVPATTIHKYLRALIERQAAQKQAETRGIDPEKLQPILAKLGEENVPDAEIADRLDAAVEDILAQARKAVPKSNDGSDIEATLVESRAKLRDVDTAGALQVLHAKIAEEEAARRRRLVPLLKERAAVERLSFDYSAAKKSLDEVTRLAPDDVSAFVDLGDLFVTTGPLEKAEKAYRGAEAAALRQGSERDLAMALSRLGGVEAAQGNLPAALKSYSDSLAIREHLAQSDPGNAGWQRDLAVAWGMVGIVQEAQGDLPAALKSYQDGLVVFERLAKSDAGNALWQRDLSVSYEKVGGVEEAQGNLPAALKSYSGSLAIRERLAKSGPGNALWQRDLSVAYDNVGGVEEAQGNLPAALKSYSGSLAIAERLAKSDPGNAGWQRDLFISNSHIGDVLVSQGNLPEALKSYQAVLAINDRLAKSDPGNAGWQRDLSVSYNKIGGVEEAQGNLPAALKSYSGSLAIAGRLAKSDPGNAGWQRDLIISYKKIADCSKSKERRANLSRALAIAQELHASGRLAPRDEWMLGDLAKLIAETPKK